MSRIFCSILLLTALAGVTPGAPEAFFQKPSPSSQPSRWFKRTIPISISRSLRGVRFEDASGERVEKAVLAALSVWESAAGVSFVVSWTDADSVSSSTQRGDRINLITIYPSPENLLMFSGDASDDAARTRVFTDRRGAIVESDIVLNPYQQFSTEGAFGAFDLQSVVTHEVGHLLGLPHSPVLGSTMNDRLAKNGTFGMVADGSRTLSMADVVAARGLYGSLEEGCCGTVVGKIEGGVAGGRIAVWLEEEATGRVVAGRYADSSGDFRFDGLSEGSYFLRADTSAESASRVSMAQSDQLIGVKAGETDSVRIAARSVKRGFGSPVAGLGSQFAGIAVRIEGGQRILLAASGRLGTAPVLRSTSALVSVLGFQMFGGVNSTGYTVMGVDIEVDPAAPDGDYSLELRDSSGVKGFLIGGLSVRKSGESGDSF